MRSRCVGIVFIVGGSLVLGCGFAMSNHPTNSLGIGSIALVMLYLVLLLALIRIIGNTINRTPRPEASSWFLLAVAFGVLGMWA